VRVREQLQMELLSLGALGDLIAAGSNEFDDGMTRDAAYVWGWEESGVWR
jgi:hypothetical protein